MKKLLIAILIFCSAWIFISTTFAFEGIPDRTEFKARRNELRKLIKDPDLSREEKRELRQELKAIQFELRIPPGKARYELKPVKLLGSEENAESPEKHDVVGFFQGGKASFYADMFNGRKTASGTIFSNELYTAAHRTLPLGTWVKVTYPKNNQSVTVLVNDRGPYVAGRIIDLSKKAFQELDSLRRGVIEVIIEVLPAENQ